MKYLVRICLVIAVIVAVVAVFHRYYSIGGSHCTVLGSGVANADENCLDKDSVSQSWAEVQQEQLKIAGAVLTTGLLFTDANGQNPAMITSQRGGPGYDLAMRYLAPYAGRQITDRPPGSQVAEHVEAKAASLMRNDGDSYGVLVINNPDGPCRYASGPGGCDLAMQLILRTGSTMVVWWPGGNHKEYAGRAQP